jgi:hypothetical protein
MASATARFMTFATGSNVKFIDGEEVKEKAA